MSEPNEGRTSETGGGLARGIILIVVTGIALGLAFNAIQHRGNTPRALAWFREDRVLGSLEDLAAAGASEMPASPTAAVPAQDPSSPSPGEPPSTGATAAADPGRHADPAMENPPAPKPDAVPSRTAAKSEGASPQATTTPAAASAPAETKPAPAPAVAAGLPVIPETRDPLEVQIGTVKKFFDAGAAAALIVDARSAAEFAEGHIRGAVNLPYDDVWQDEAKLRAFDAGGRPLIVYCGGGECELSKNLGYALIEAGKKKVLVYMGGIAEWEKAGYPMDRGAGGGSR